VRFKQTQHFLASGDLATFQHMGLRLRDDMIDGRKELVDLALELQSVPEVGCSWRCRSCPEGASCASSASAVRIHAPCFTVCCVACRSF
jgi:hypothetical protein